MVEGMDAALFAATNRLEGRTETPRLDAELLMAHALRLSRGEMLLKRRDLTKPAEFDALIARRADGEPVAYIRGAQEFWDLTLKVTPDVLIPRADSETVIEAAQSHFAGRGLPTKILDLGTGSGALLLAALSLFPRQKGLASTPVRQLWRWQWIMPSHAALANGALSCTPAGANPAGRKLWVHLT
jgi:release factor glutamine methyltransferase